jgi:lambda repressor-like predicted transcriptional regulator
MTPLEIRAHMLLQGKNMKQFSESIGTSRQNIQYVVNGKRKSKNIRDAIAKFIGKPISEIWPETSTKEQAA